MARRNTQPLQCVLCGRFIGYSEEIHYYRPNGSLSATEPPDEELSHQRCWESQKRLLKRVVSGNSEE